MYNLNNFVLMISLSRLKNVVDKNFIELKNQNIINVQFKSNIVEILKNDVEEFEEKIFEEEFEEKVFKEKVFKEEEFEEEEFEEELNINITKNNSKIEKLDDYKYKSVEETNFLFNSFIHIADSFKFDSEDWYLIYEDTDKIKNK
jgi:hypothetical protein